MNQIIKNILSILIAFIIVHLAFTLCNDYQVISV
jgi:hypothetical protein